jgi:UDP-N-acetylglucosamine 2-epimerase (non-hydrolysing)
MSSHHNKLKVMTIVGTRPEIIRLSEVIKRLDEHVNHILVHTGQNYDYELNEVFFKDLELRQPDHFMNADRSSLGATIGDIFKKTEEILIKEKPDAFLVLGDTNSCLAAYMAKRLHIPIFHMEAGNRCFDENVPEETNRRVIDHIADINLVYTEHARRHLLSEGLPHRRIYLTGSPMREVLNAHMDKIKNSDILKQLNLKPKGYFLVSVHREENVDNPENLNKILTVLNRLAETYQLPVIVSTHPRTRKRVEQASSLTTPCQEQASSLTTPCQEVEGLSRLGVESSNSSSSLISQLRLKATPCQPHPSSLISFLKPFGFLAYNHLQMHAACVLSDSGTISEESAMLNFPAISLRESMERPEAQDAGTIVLTGFDPDVVLSSIEMVMKEHAKGDGYKEIPLDYQVENTSWRVLKLIMGVAKLSPVWSGIKTEQ